MENAFTKINDERAGTRLTACNLCGSTEWSHLFDETPLENFTFGVVQCLKCGLIATDPIPSDDFLEKLYSIGSYKENTVSGTYCLDEHVSSGDFGFVLNRLRLQLGEQPGKRLLDVGCGMGAFVKSALEKGWDSYGIEPSPFASGIARKEMSDRIQTGFLHEGGYAESSFDAVTLWYVLEHVTDPTSILEKAHQLLKPGGMLFIAVPNARYILLRRRLVQLKTGQLGTIHAHEHLYQYTSETLKRLLNKTGFDPLSEHSSAPFMVGGPIVNSAKRASKLAVDALMLTMGINMGGILMFAHRK